VTRPTPGARPGALFAAAEEVCDDSEFYHAGAALVSDDLITELRTALDPLKEVGATPAQALDRRYRSDAP
jgi:hypothetical protein